MSDRFSRLEFEHARTQQDAELRPDPGTPVRSAEYYHAMADAQCRAGEYELSLQSYTRALREDRARVAAWVGQVQMLVELAEYGEARLWADKSLELFKSNGDLLAAKARACARMKDPRAANACSDASLQSPGSSSLRWLSRGEVMLPTSPARARDCFDKALNEPGADWHERLQIARVYLHYDKPTAAIDFACQAQEMNPAHPTPWTVMARCYLAHGRREKAAACIGRALEVDPENRIAKLVRVEVIRTDRTSAMGRAMKGWFAR